MEKTDIRSLIDGFLRADKTLAGSARWEKAEEDVCHRWTQAVSVDGELPGIQFEIKAYSQEAELKFRILLLSPKCVWRLDYDFDGHLNSLVAPTLAGELIKGPHYHSWSDNRMFGTRTTLPRRLSNARPLPENVRTYHAALRWFLSETNIFAASVELPDLPRRETLL